MISKPPHLLTDRQRFTRVGQGNLQRPQLVAVSDKTRLAQVGRRRGPVVPNANFSQKTHFVLNVENHVRHNLAELVLYEKCIRETLAYRGRDGYANSQDQSLYIRQAAVTTWNPSKVFAPAVAPLFHQSPNLWDEFADGTGPQNSAFLSEHPITSNLKGAMQDEVSRLLFLLYDKYQGNPGPEAKYVDRSLSFGPIQFLAALSNRNKTFVGSSNMSGFVSGNRVIIILSDVKSAYSLVGHATHKVDHYRSSRLSISGFTYQFYIWSVGMRSYDWYKRTKNIMDKTGRKKDWFGINPALLP